MRKATQEVFIANDDKVFLSELECELHERQLPFNKVLRFIEIAHDEDYDSLLKLSIPDVTEFIILNINELNQLLGR
jgi:hypothetical protein